MKIENKPILEYILQNPIEIASSNQSASGSPFHTLKKVNIYIPTKGWEGFDLVRLVQNSRIELSKIANTIVSNDNEFEDKKKSIQKVLDNEENEKDIDRVYTAQSNIMLAYPKDNNKLVNKLKESLPSWLKSDEVNGYFLNSNDIDNLYIKDLLNIMVMITKYFLKEAQE